MVDNELTYKIRGCAMEVFKTLGPGLLESVYEKALMIELKNAGLKAVNQVPIPVLYKGEPLDLNFRLDILVEDEVIIELKSVDKLETVHFKQILSYLKLTNKQVGFLINFNESNFNNGLRRVVNEYKE